MERCLDCNSLLTKEETVCIECGSKVGGDEASVAGFIATIVTMLFYISSLTLVAAPFVDRLPSFVFCLMINAALLFAMRSAKDHAQKIKKR